MRNGTESDSREPISNEYGGPHS